MKVPLSPPTLEVLLRSIVEAGGVERLTRLLGDPAGPAPNGRYLHWDELRYRQPPPGLSREDWWFSVKTARRLLYKPIPITDKTGRPFVFALVDPILALLHRLDRDAAGRIRLAAPIANSATRDGYLVRSLIEEAINSSQLEGASTTRQVAKEMLRQGRRPQDKSERMIFNNFQAMRAISERASQPLTPDTILDLHRLLTRDTLDDPNAAGRLRRADERVDVVDHRQLALIRHALRHPGAVYTIEGHRQSHAVVYQTARSDLLQLVELGLVSKRKAGHAFVFEAVPELGTRLTGELEI